MTPNRYLWAQAKDRLVAAVTAQGLSAELETWRQRKESQEAQPQYNSWLYYKKWNPDEEE